MKQKLFLLSIIVFSFIITGCSRNNSLAYDESIQVQKEENKLEFAFQLAALRYQGWSYSLNKEISLEIIRYIAKQVGTVPKALKLYSLRSNTSRDHIES